MRPAAAFQVAMEFGQIEHLFAQLGAHEPFTGENGSNAVQDDSARQLLSRNGRWAQFWGIK